MTITLDLLPVRRMSTDELVFRLRDALGRRKLTGWDLTFAISIAARAKRGNWILSAKQEREMRRIVADLRHGVPDLPGEDTLIDDGDRE